MHYSVLETSVSNLVSKIFTICYDALTDNSHSHLSEETIFIMPSKQCNKECHATLLKQFSTIMGKNKDRVLFISAI